VQLYIFYCLLSTTRMSSLKIESQQCIVSEYVCIDPFLMPLNASYHALITS